MEEMLPLLPTLVSLARSGSVTATGRELGVPRSTISRRIARLEAVLGVKVAERTTHRLSLTAPGRRLVEGAVGALKMLETVREQVVQSAGEVRGTLRVAMPAGLSGAFIGWFLAFLHERHPTIDIELSVNDRVTPAALAAETAFDLVLMMGQPEPSSWVRRRLARAEFIAVASPDYLSRLGIPKKIEALSRHLLLTSVSPGTTPTWPRLRGASFPISPKLVTNDLSTLRDVAIAGMGIALLPIHTVFGELANETLVRVLPNQIGQQIDLFALYLPERRASPVLKAVLAAVSDFAVVAQRP